MTTGSVERLKTIFAGIKSGMALRAHNSDCTKTA